MNNAGLIRALSALRRYLPHIVVCGAWAWYVYRNYMGKPLERTAVFTRDLDCVTQNHVPVEGIGLLDGVEAAGFEWVPKGDETPPATVFVWPNRDSSRS